MNVLISRDAIVEWTGEEDPLRRAKCLDFGTPARDYDPWFTDYWAALEVCNGIDGSPACPVRERCLRRALINNERWGIWGGMLHCDRKRLKDRFPHNPEMWKWHPPTVNPPRSRAQEPGARRASRRSSTATASPRS